MSLLKGAEVVSCRFKSVELATASSAAPEVEMGKARETVSGAAGG